MATSVYFSEEQIQERIKSLAAEINEAYKDVDELIVIAILNGSFMFCADLVRHLTIPIRLDFMGATSYHGTERSDDLKIDRDIKVEVKDRHVLLLEDIVDTGNTLAKIYDYFEGRGLASLKLASLLFKPARLEKDVKIDYLGFEIEDKFVIGYGLDVDGLYRELPYIGIYSDD